MSEPTENIRVAVRIKPTTSSSILNCDKDTSEVYFTDKPNQRYHFDQVYCDEETNKMIYDSSVQDIVRSTLNGTNSTIIAYGSTGSGKTFTMTGGVNNPGIINYSIGDIFDEIQKDTKRVFTVSLSFFEIYNEKIIDLMANTQNPVRVAKNLSKQFINSSVDFLSLYRDAFEKRSTASTLENNRSSRSHAIVRITIESKSNEGDCAYSSYLDLVDLAGSENQGRTGATGARQTEGANINKSLLALSKLIYDAANNKSGSIAGIRDSKLTMVLKDSIGGNAKTVIITTLANEEVHRSSTQSSITFAKNAMKVTNKPIVNKVAEAKSIATLQKEIERLNQIIKDLEKDKSSQEGNDEKVAQAKKEITELTGITLGGIRKKKPLQLPMCDFNMTQTQSTPKLLNAQIERTKIISQLGINYLEGIECDSQGNKTAEDSDDDYINILALPKLPKKQGKKKIRLPGTDPKFEPESKTKALRPSYINDSEIQFAREESNRLREESSRLRELTNQFQTDMINANNEKEKLENENHTLKSKIRELTTKIDNFESEQPEIDRRNEEDKQLLSERINQLNSLINRRNNEIAELKKAKIGLESENETISNDLKRLQNIENMFEEMKEGFDGISDENAVLQDEINRLNDVNINIGYEYKAMELELSTKLSCYEEAKKKAESANTKLQELTKVNENLSKQIGEYKLMAGSADDVRNRIRVKMIQESLVRESTNSFEIEENDLDFKCIQTEEEEYKPQLSSSTVTIFETDREDENAISKEEIDIGKIDIREFCTIKQKKYQYSIDIVIKTIFLIVELVLMYFFLVE